jgi:hypothetical protein
MKSLVDKFLSLRCATDVLECVLPLKRPERDISEAMVLLDAIRPVVLKNPGQYKVVDVHADSPIVGVLIAHLLPVELVSSYNWREKQKRDFSKIHHFAARDDDMP